MTVRVVVIMKERHGNDNSYDVDDDIANTFQLMMCPVHAG